MSEPKPSQPYPLFIPLSTYRKNLAVLEADFGKLQENVQFLDESEQVRINTEADFPDIEDSIIQQRPLLASKAALLNKYKIFKLANEGKGKTSDRLREVKKRTDEIIQEREKARKAEEEQRSIERAREIAAAMSAELASRTTRPDSPATLGSASTLSTLRAAMPSTESLLTLDSSSLSHGVPSTGPINGQYVERPIANLDVLLAELDDSPPASRTPLYQDPYSQPMHWHNHSENSATLRRLDTPEPPKQSLPPPPRRQPLPPRRQPTQAENPAFRLGQAGPPRFPGAASQQQSDANHISSQGQHHAQPSEASFYTAPSRNSHVYSQSAFAQRSFLNLTSDSSSEGHGTQGSILSLDTDVFGTHH